MLSPKNEREAPGFRHGEERGCDFSRLESSRSKRITITILSVNWFAVFMADTCHSSRLGNDVEAARGTAKHSSYIGAELLPRRNRCGNNVASPKAFMDLYP